jgi:hypothetical protein
MGNTDQKRRAGPGSKTRTGCITCKLVSSSLSSRICRNPTILTGCRTRRVKCDEAKPTCIRCRDLRLKCWGYLKPKSERAAQRLVPLVPKTHTLATPAVSLSPGPSQQLFASDQDSRYFKIFCDTTASNLGEYLKTHIWSYHVLQASEQESFIKHAVIALGALNKAVDIRMEATIQTGGSWEGVITHGAQHYQVRQSGIPFISCSCMSRDSADMFLEQGSKNVSRLLSDYCAPQTFPNKK